MHSRSRKTTIDYSDTIHRLLRNGYKYCYLITIAKHQVKDYVTVEELQEVHWQLKCKLTDLYVPLVTFELSSKYHQLHMHGIALTKRAVYYQKNNSIEGFRIEWRRAYNLVGAISYCLKDAQDLESQQEILAINYYMHNYGFHDDQYQPLLLI